MSEAAYESCEFGVACAEDVCGSDGGDEASSVVADDAVYGAGDACAVAGYEAAAE